MIQSYEICRCKCHRGYGLKHIVACCFPCPVCKRKIKRGYHTAHMERCEKERLELAVDIIEKERTNA